MRNNTSPTIKYLPIQKLLVAYYGLIQIVHMLALTRAYALLKRNGELTFLAQAPAGGWSTQAQHFLIGLGGIDFLNALLSLLFVYGFFTGKSWWFWLGTSTLTVSLVSAWVYAYGTISSGAWIHNPVEYFIMTGLYLPITILVILLASQATNGRTDKNMNKSL